MLCRRAVNVVDGEMSEAKVLYLRTKTRYVAIARDKHKLRGCCAWLRGMAISASTTAMHLRLAVSHMEKHPCLKNTRPSCLQKTRVVNRLRARDYSTNVPVRLKSAHGNDCVQRQ